MGTIKKISGAVLGALVASAIAGSAAAAGEADPKIHAMVPDRVKKEGLQVGYADYPPDQFTDAQGKPTGWVVDLLNEVGRVMGVPVRFTLVSSFQSLLPGLAAKKFDLAAAGYSITEQRKQSFDFVSYFNSGNSIVIKKGAPAITSEALCGHTGAIAVGSYFANIVDSFSKRCVADGKPAVKLLTFPTQEAVLVAIDSGRAEFTIGSLSANAYLTKQAGDRYQVSGQPFFRTTAGFAFHKSEPQIRDAIAAAMQALVKNGTYAKVQAKWGVQAGALDNPRVNP